MKTAVVKNESAIPSRSVKPFFGKGRNDSVQTNAALPFFNHQPIQTKLTIGQPGDKYEQEADAMADTVVQRLSNSETVQAKPDNPASAVTPPHPHVQAKCAACADKEKLLKKETKTLEPDEEEIQRKCAACETEEELHKKESSSSEAAVSPAIVSSLNATKGSGSLLPHGTRGQMETAMGADFSKVRIHNDSSAVQMSKALHAQAFTHGNDIYFNSGKYDPTGKDGQHLLAHELTHTLQQGASVNKTIQRTTHGRGGPVFTLTNCSNPLIPLTPAMAGIAAHAQIAGILSTLGIHPQAIPRATKRSMGSPAPFGTNLGFADLWTIAGSMAHISEIKSTNIGHNRARREARHYADRHNEWNLRYPSIFPDDMAYRALVGTHPIAGDVLDLFGFTGTGLAIGPFIADPLKLLFIEGDSQGALVYWCQGPGIMNPLLVLLLKKALDALKKMLESAKRALDDFIERLPRPGEVAEAFVIALVILLFIAALVCVVIAILCLAGVVTAPCAALGVAGAVAATATALVLLGINLPGFTDGADPIAAITITDVTQPSEMPPTERNINENTVFAMAAAVFTLPDPLTLAQTLSPTISIEQAKSAIRGIANTLDAAGEANDSSYLRNRLSRIESAAV